jgi:prolyl-tRNA synthetase
MRMSQLFSQTLREAPAEADVASHQLLLRAGFVRPLGAGLFTYLPLARRSLTKIEAIIRAEINGIGSQEITMPVVNPAELWRQTGRWGQIGAEMGRFTDRAGRELVLALTHEEVAADLARQEVRSHRHLPRLLYHIYTTWRDDPRSGTGLIRARGFTSLEAYSLDADWAGLEAQYRGHHQAFSKICQRCGLPVIAVLSDTGMMGGRLAHAFISLTPIGDDTVLLCDACGYAADRRVARFAKPALLPAAPQPLTKVPTPGTKTIADLAELLKVPASQTAKAVFMVATLAEGDLQREQFIFAVVRGDMELNETKLAKAVKARALRPAREDEIRAMGAVPGYASPIGLKDVFVVADDAISKSPNLVAGANAEGYHLLNTNYGRDYTAQIVCDLAAASDGAGCPLCTAPMRALRGVEVGNLFQPGTRYTEALGCTFQGSDGQAHPVIMGSYGMSTGRLLACIAEAHHDDFGLCWPISVAPFEVHLVVAAGSAPPSGETPQAAADRLYAALQAAGVEVLYDDRDERPGVKFMDADLIGAPLRITVGDRSLKQGGVELKRRTSKDKTLILMNEAVERVQAEITSLYAELARSVVAPPYAEGP